MARKPSTRINADNSRESVWRVIRALRTQFTIFDLRYHTALGIDTIRDYVNGLVRSGYLKQDGTRENLGRHAKLYTLINDTGSIAPRVRRDGSKVTIGRGNQLMWRTMKVLKTFNLRQLAVTASTPETVIKESTAKKYCQALRLAGYLRMEQAASGGQQAIYRVVEKQYSGPKSPVIQHIKQIFDPNTGTVVWPKPEDGGCHE